jgi:hypothetical protein
MFCDFLSVDPTLILICDVAVISLLFIDLSWNGIQRLRLLIIIRHAFTYRSLWYLLRRMSENIPIMNYIWAN